MYVIQLLLQPRASLQKAARLPECSAGCSYLDTDVQSTCDDDTVLQCHLYCRNNGGERDGGGKQKAGGGGSWLKLGWFHEGSRGGWRRTLQELYC